MIVADTNLVVGALVAPAGDDAAARVRERDPAWVAPPLWASEFRNVLATYVRTGRLSEAQAVRLWHAGRGLVESVVVDPLQALAVAFESGVSGYDAEFAALADALDVPLVTADRRVREARPDRAVSPEAFAAGG